MICDVTPIKNDTDRRRWFAILKASQLVDKSESSEVAFEALGEYIKSNPDKDVVKYLTLWYTKVSPRQKRLFCEQWSEEYGSSR